jgi:hypothetical protein
MPCSTMVVRFAVNEVVVGSSPTGAVRRLTFWQFFGFCPNKNPSGTPNPPDLATWAIVSEKLKSRG